MKLSHALHLPYPSYLGRVVRRSILTWLLLRLLLFALFFVYTWSFSVAIRVPTFGMPVLFVRLDRQLFRELLLPANLGASELWFWGVSLSVVIGLDLAAAALLGPG